MLLGSILSIHVQIQGVWYYSTEFFAEAGLSHPLSATLLSSVIFMIATVASVPLIEKAREMREIATNPQDF